MPLQLVRDMVWQTLGFLHMVSSIAELKLNEQRPSIFHPMRYGLELYCKADHSKVSLLFKMFHSAAVRECGLPTFPPAFASPPSISTGFPSVPLIQPFFFFFFFFFWAQCAHVSPGLFFFSPTILANDWRIRAALACDWRPRRLSIQFHRCSVRCKRMVWGSLT